MVEANPVGFALVGRPGEPAVEMMLAQEVAHGIGFLDSVATERKTD